MLFGKSVGKSLAELKTQNPAGADWAKMEISRILYQAKYPAFVQPHGSAPAIGNDGASFHALCMANRRRILGHRRRLLAMYLLWRRLRNRRRYWTHEIFRKRPYQGQYHTTMLLLRRDPEKFRNYFRMNEATFDLLLALTETGLQKKSRRGVISPEERLAVTLSFLASGTPYRRLAYSFRISNQAISSIVAETCGVVYDVLKDKYLAMPQTEAEWKVIADGFWARWNIPNTIGAIDGKHIQIKKPANSGTSYFNYKGSFSLVLMAMCDHRYRIVWAEFGNYGSDSDGRVFDRCAFRSGLDEDTLAIPGPADLPGTDLPLNYFCVADAAFPLTKHIMKPLPGNNLTLAQRIYNYRISRARRVIENVFGIMACKWRVLLKPIETSPATADAITKAICALHNFVIDEDKIHSPSAQADTGLGNEDNGRWRRDVDPLSSANVRARGANRATVEAQNISPGLGGILQWPWRSRMAK